MGSFPETYNDPINLRKNFVIQDYIRAVFSPKSKAMKCHVNYKYKHVGTSVIYRIKNAAVVLIFKIEL